MSQAVFTAAPKQSLSPISVRSFAKQAVGLEPAPKMLEMARRARHEDIPVEFVEASAETIPLDDCSSDTVVTTWTMCSIPVVRRPLARPRRAGTRGSRDAGRIAGHEGRPPQPYTVISFGPGGPKPFKRFIGAEPAG